MTPRFDVISIFPTYFEPLKLSLIGKAEENRLVEIRIHDLRDHAEGAHRDRKSTRLNSSHIPLSRMPSSA